MDWDETWDGLDNEGNWEAEKYLDGSGSGGGDDGGGNA